MSVSAMLTAAMLKVTGSLEKSTEIMKLSNNLIRLPQMSRSMKDMSKELMKVRQTWLTQAGILEEMMNDTLEAGAFGEDQEELEEEAQAEVDQVLNELTDGASPHLTPGKLGQAASTSNLPQPVSEDKDTADLDHMQAQLDTLLRG